MAEYAGFYQSDLGYRFQLVRLPVFAVGENGRQETTRSFDAQFLPSIFQAEVSNNRVTCSAEVDTLRHARAYFSATTYLFIPCPWMGGTVEFQQFFQELDANPQVILLLLTGERVNPAYTKLLLRV